MTKIKMVMVTAKKRGTVIAQSGNYHFDPAGVPEARKREIPMDVAVIAKNKGLVELGATSTATTVNLNAPFVNQAAAERREQTAGEDADLLPDLLGMGGADTRDTTNFERDPNTVARHGVQEVGTTEAKSDEDDDDGHDDEMDPIVDQTDMEMQAPVRAAPVAGDAGGADGPPIEDDDGDSQHGEGPGSSEDGDKDSIEQEVAAIEQLGAQGDEVKATAPKARRTRNS